MNPRDIYKTNRRAGWTRIDMLLELYRAAIGHIENAVQLMQAGNEAEVRVQLMRAVRVVGGLKFGLDLSQGEMPQNMDRLFDYVLDCLSDGSSERLCSAVNVLDSLQQAFRKIRTEAIQLEANGQIPPLDSDQSMTVLA